MEGSGKEGKQHVDQRYDVWGCSDKRQRYYLKYKDIKTETKKDRKKIHLHEYRMHKVVDFAM